ncbi:MAG: hypothetical protein INR63_23645 [Actinomycetospora chiangmaiensis]|nr:hypothetical protein [Actinomycetospora chiangmaiensis]
MALDARLRAERPSAQGLARLLARTKPVPPSLPAALEPHQAPSADCAARIAGATRALDLPAPDSAAALRSLFLGEPQPVLAGAGP